MICPNKACGAEFPDGLVYCPSCGKQLVSLSRRGPVNKSLWPYVVVACSLLAIATAACAVVFWDKMFPPVCNIHKGVLLVNGSCTNVCGTCGKHLDADGNCPDFCKVHGIHLVNGSCTNVCGTCGKHLDADGGCPDFCKVHGMHFVNGKCPQVCGLPGCGKHLEKDGGKRCEDTCDIHKNVHLLGGLCRECNPPFDDIDEWVYVREEHERDGRAYPVFGIRTNPKWPGRDHVNWLLDNEDVGRGDLVPDPKSDDQNRKTFAWSPKDGFGLDETHVIGVITKRHENGSPFLSRAKTYTWTKKTCGIHKGVVFVDGKCPECAKITDALEKARAAFRAKKWKEGQDALAEAKVPESSIADPELQYYIGLCLEDGLGGAAKSFEDMLKWYRKSAEQGYAEAQYRLGARLTMPLPQYQHFRNVAEGKEWLRKASEQGHGKAAALLKNLEADGVQ